MQEVDTASFEDVVYALGNSAGASPDRLLWLRTLIWWELNDRYRIRDDGTCVPNVPHWPESDERANMEAMLDLLAAREMTPSDQVQKGELLRLLGRFDEAVAVLKAVPADGHSECRAVRIERLARQGRLTGQVARGRWDLIGSPTAWMSVPPQSNCHVSKRG